MADLINIPQQMIYLNKMKPQQSDYDPKAFNILNTPSQEIWHVSIFHSTKQKKYITAAFLPLCCCETWIFMVSHYLTSLFSESFTQLYVAYPSEDLCIVLVRH